MERVMKTTRRDFFSVLGATGSLVLSGCSGKEPAGAAGHPELAGPADVTLRIAPVLADIAKDHTISTIG